MPSWVSRTVTALCGRISQPSQQTRRVAPVQRVQHQRRQREIVDPVHARGNLDLLPVVPVDLDQDLDPPGVGFGADSGDEIERLGNHEAAGPGLLDRVSDRVEANGPDARRLEPVEHVNEVSPAFRMVDVDIDLLAGERRPQQRRRSVPRLVPGERQAWTGRYRASRSDSRAPSGKTREYVRNIPAYGEASPRSS